MRRGIGDDSRFAWKALTATAIVVGVILILLLARQVASVLLVVFAGILLAVFLDGIAKLIEGLTKMRRGGALAIAIVLFFGFFAAVWIFIRMPFFDLRQIGFLYGLPVSLWIYSKQFIIIGKFFGGAVHRSTGERAHQRGARFCHRPRRGIRPGAACTAGLVQRLIGRAVCTR